MKRVRRKAFSWPTRKTRASSKEIPSSSIISPPDQSRFEMPALPNSDPLPRMRRRKGQRRKGRHLQLDDDHEEKQKATETTCRVCLKSFDIFDDYRSHYCPSPSSSSCEDVDVKKKKEKLICKICSRSFNGVRRFAYHQRYCVPRGEDEEDVIDEPWLDGERFEYIARQYADAAIEHLNKESNKQYILVKPGPFQTAHIAYGPLVHFNFKAKTTDCPEPQTFFAQLRMHPDSDPFDIDCVVTLGSNVPHWSSPATNGCSYCKYAVHHPDAKEEVPKLLKGVDYKEAVWLYGDELRHVLSDSTISDDDEDGFHSPSDSDWQHSSS